jgi:LysR family glycine cleavage system transcriptional activator
MNNKTRLPSLRALKVFQVAGRHLSFKLAAEELFISASAVSHQVRNLEEELKTDLFVRKTRALDFTESGQRYFNFLNSMFARLEVETLQLFSDYGRSQVRLCVPPFFAEEMLLPHLQEFQQISPGTDIRLSTQPSLMKAHPSEADLSILLGKGDWPDLRSYRLFSRKLVVGCAPGLMANLDPRSFASLDGQTLLVHENRPHAWEHWARALDIPAPRPANIIRFDSMSSVVQAASQGLGVALVSWPLSKHRFEKGELVRVFEQTVDTGEHFYIAHRRNEAIKPEISKLIEWLLKSFGTSDGTAAK